jgi:hypothetical protein
MRFACVVPAFVLALVGSACKSDDDSQTSDDTSAATDGGTAATGDSGDPTAPTTGRTDDDTATDAGDDDSASDGAESTTGDPLACVDVSECRLLDDCCTCEAFHISEDVPPSCDLDCDRTKCQTWNTGLVCSHTCLLRLVDCDPALIECHDPQPRCEDGFQPSIEDRCWTDQCVPAELCAPY